MKKSFYFVKNHLNQLEANDIEAEEFLSTIKTDEILRGTFTKPRNVKHHRKFWAMIGLVYQNQDKYEVKEVFITEIKLQCGLFEEHITLGGKMVFVPKSISFDEMDQFEFEKFYDKAVNVCLKHFVPGDNQELIDRISRF